MMGDAVAIMRTDRLEKLCLENLAIGRARSGETIQIPHAVESEVRRQDALSLAVASCPENAAFAEIGKMLRKVIAGMHQLEISGHVGSNAGPHGEEAVSRLQHGIVFPNGGTGIMRLP